MKIKLKGNWIITDDSMNYKLSEYRYEKDKKGVEQLKLSNTTYYSTLNSLLRAYKEKYIKSAECEFLSELLKVSEETDAYIREVLEGI